ncbi:hypothetical protein RYD26_08740 [Pasteurellaceae bacterium LIM206]|nr:hypothetical protein [Pasteurellaceae bacterium LIM206]
MKLKDLIKAPPDETYLKNSSRLTTGLFILAGLLYYPTHGYGSFIALVVILIIMVGQKMMLSQINKDFADMYQAKKLYQEKQNIDYLKFIDARSAQILHDNKILSDKGKKELLALREYVEPILKAELNQDA